MTEKPKKEKMPEWFKKIPVLQHPILKTIQNTKGNGMFLTDWESGEDIYISREAEILAMQRLPGATRTTNGITQEFTARTRIELVQSWYLVRETPQEISELRYAE